MNMTATTESKEWDMCEKSGGFCNGKKFRRMRSDYEDCVCTPEERPITMQIDSSDDIGIKIIEALGLPKHIRKMEMVFEAGHPVIIKCEFAQWNINSEAEGALTGLHEYELRKK